MANKEGFTFYSKAGNETGKKQVGLVLSCFFLLSLLQSQIFTKREMAAEDNKSISIPQTGMNRDLHPANLTEQHYTFALNANIESEDGNVGMRSNEHSNMKCLDFDGFKVIGYKNDLTSGNIYFFITNPDTKISKITYFRPTEDVSTLSDQDIETFVNGGDELCAGMQTLIKDSASDPCLNFSIYHPVKTIEIKTEKCGKCIYWTDDYNPPRYVIVEKALEPDEDGDIWYHYHGYKLCGEKDENGKILSRDEFIERNGCFLACEKLRVFPLLDQPCIEPAQIEYGGSLRAGVYQFAVALCDEFGNEKTNYTSLTNPVHIFDEQYTRIEDGKWGARTNLGIRLVVSNLDRQVSHYKVAVIQNTVGYNGETQPVIDYFIEGVHPITEKTIYYYSDLNNKRTTFEHISLRKAVYNTSRGIVSVGNRLLQYGLTAEKEWNLQPVVSLMGHFLKWQASVAHEDLYKDGNACSLYVGYMRNEVYPFSISFKTSSGYKTPAFILVPPPSDKARQEMDKESIPFQSINNYAPDCSGIERKYVWQYRNTAGQAEDVDDAVVLDEEPEECKNPATVGQTFVVESDFVTYRGKTRFIIDYDDIVGEPVNYLSENIGAVACANKDLSGNSNAKLICDVANNYRTDGTQSQMFGVDGIEPPAVGDECEVPQRQESILSAPVSLITGLVEDYIYKNRSELEHVPIDYLYTTGGENQNKYSILFNYQTMDDLTVLMDKNFFGDNAGVVSGDGERHLCSQFYPYVQPGSILKTVSDSIYILDTMPCTCGCYMENYCQDPSVSKTDYNNFQNYNYILGGYIADKDGWNEEINGVGNWRAGRSTSTVINDMYRSKVGPNYCIDKYWPEAKKKLEGMVYQNSDTGIAETDWKYEGYVNNATFNNPTGDQLNIGFASEYVVWKFQRKVMTNARFIKINRPAEWDNEGYKEENKVLYLEGLGKIDGIMDAVSTNYIRISFWKDVENWVSLGRFPMEFDGSNYRPEYSSTNSAIINISRPSWATIDEEFFRAIGQNHFYVTIESPIVAVPWIMTFRQIQFCEYKNKDTADETEEESKKPSRAILGVSFATGKTIYPYIFGIREKEINKVDLTTDSITLRSTVIFASKCQTCGDRPINCKPRKFKCGDFAYWESSELYPANYELYDSTRMKIKTGKTYQDQKKADAYSSIISKLTEYYGSPVRDKDGLSHFEGHSYGEQQTSTVFCQQPIRHYKFPDNRTIPFMNSDERGYDIASEIYPVGVMVDENIIQVFLDFAVDSGLITQAQRDTVVGYELYRGDRRLNRSVVASGLAYDMIKYVGDDGNINIYPNYPYNDLSPDQYNYTTGKRTDFISHPFDKAGNVWFSFHSPDIYFNKPELPNEVCIDGFQRGMSIGSFVEVEDHPKWTILGPAAYKTAATLAVTESAATVAAMIAEELQIRAQSGYIGGSAGITGGGFLTNLSVAMLFSSMVMTISQTLAKGPILYGKYRYDWLNTFINNGPRRNHAWYYTSVGLYNSMMTISDDSMYERNFLRGLSSVKYMKSGMYPMMDASMSSKWASGKTNPEGEFLFVNNIDRESALFLSFGNPGESNDLKYLLQYPTYVSSYDNSRVDDMMLSGNDVTAGKTYENPKSASYICSPYMRLMRFKPDQYGQIEDIKWISIGGCGFFTGEKKLIFGGDTVITRFSLKRKFPLFYNNAFGIGDMIPFPYMDYRNVGFPRYFVNYDTGEDALEVTDNERFNSWTSSNKGRYMFYPNRKSLYELNGYSGGKYVDGRFYTWFYGIPQFLVESEVNCNFRLEGSQPHEWFYPKVGDFVWWTQEKNVSIQRDNDYRISPVYMSRTTLTPMVLPATYERKFYDCAYQRPNGVIWSRQDVSENSQTDPWLTYKPMDYHEFPTKNGKLIHMKCIESNQILARFEDQVSLHNAIDVIKERTTPGQEDMGTGGLFASRPLEYNTTDLGYSGTQSTEMISSEFGHFWVDAKRAQVFMTDPNGRNLKELSTGVRHWLKRHLPFKILRYGITNIRTGEGMTYEDVDNKFIGIGLSLGWDNRYKRVFITKRDYIPVQDRKNYKYDGGRFYYGSTEIKLTDTRYFKDVSFTIGYSCLKQEWISYYSFCPDYYIEQQHFFQSGLNFSAQDLEQGLWSHLLTNKSFQTFYGTTYPFVLEVPIKEKYNGSILSSIEYELDARKYVDDVNYVLDRQIGLDNIVIYNDTNNSGDIKLIPEQKNNLMQRIQYPKIVDNHTEVLDTEVYRRHKLNDFFNRVNDDRSEIPIWEKDENDIEKTVNPDALNFRQSWLDRLRGSWMLMRIRKIIKNRKIIFQWVISEDKIRNR